MMSELPNPPDSQEMVIKAGTISVVLLPIKAHVSTVTFDSMVTVFSYPPSERKATSEVDEMVMMSLYPLISISLFVVVLMLVVVLYPFISISGYAEPEMGVYSISRFPIPELPQLYCTLSGDVNVLSLPVIAQLLLMTTSGSMVNRLFDPLTKKLASVVPDLIVMALALPLIVKSMGLVPSISRAIVESDIVMDSFVELSPSSLPPHATNPKRKTDKYKNLISVTPCSYYYG